MFCHGHSVAAGDHPTTGVLFDTNLFFHERDVYRNRCGLIIVFLEQLCLINECTYSRIRREEIVIEHYMSVETTCLRRVLIILSVVQSQLLACPITWQGKLTTVI